MPSTKNAGLAQPGPGLRGFRGLRGRVWPAAVLTAVAAVMPAVLGCAQPAADRATQDPPMTQPEPYASTVPTPRGDANSMLAHQQLLAKARAGVIDLYFAGDSITRRWGATDAAYADLMASWREHFFGWNAANFGWGGDSTQHILWRIEHGELEGVNPRVIVLLAGTNNLSGRPHSAALVAEVTAGVAAIMSRCRRLAPGATVVLMGILPRDDEPGLGPTIRAINANLAAMADGERVRYLDIGGALTGPDGRLLPGVSPDGLHLAEPGYRIWAAALTPVLTELLGPRGAEDHAPPPTGDPSAQAAK